jgi:predicted adenylyl cyclase CyaB
MKNIEVELRSLINKEQYNKLNRFFRQQGEYLGEEKQITYYFSGQNDLRIQKSNSYAKIWMKKGRLHDTAREEIEIKFRKQDFDLIYKLFLSLSFTKEIEWRRKRRNYKWHGASVALDYTEGYGYIIEMEMMTNKADRKIATSILVKKFAELGIAITPKEEFNKKFNYYKKNWQKLLSKRF